METKHRCKLCFRRFSNGRALGGHMRSHCHAPSPSSSPSSASSLSSISDSSPEESVARCLVMLSRDSWSRSDCWNETISEDDDENEDEEFRPRRRRARRSKKPVADSSKLNADNAFVCPFCSKVFGSGQALGGHKRSHLSAPSSATLLRRPGKNTERCRDGFLDLNLPPSPLEEEMEIELSVVSDASK
ncbi:zinc finger protein ZAT9-like [Typha angustifolia]|uniref:zinc finger protein ZAT9-like n=1 Tax=Typha angustifolia TaxID=59011 RepID=UPI003C2B2C34